MHDVRPNKWSNAKTMQLTTIEPSTLIVPIKRAEIRANGLIIEEGLTPDEWLKDVVSPLRELISTMRTSALWWWGDALAYGEQKYGEMYSQALEESDYNYGTLRNAKFVSERMPLLSRLNNLTWTHHAEIANNVDDKGERSKWLRKAAEDGMSTSQLRKAIRDSKKEINDKPNEDAGQFGPIDAAKALLQFFEKEDVTKWDMPRCRLWMNDLRPIAAIYELLVTKAGQ